MTKGKVFYILVICFVVVNLINLGVKFSGLAFFIGFCVLLGGIIIGVPWGFLLGKRAEEKYHYSWRKNE